jgi:hypothetical protein
MFGFSSLGRIQTIPFALALFYLLGASATQAQLLPIVVPTANLGVPTGVGVENGGFEAGVNGYNFIGEATLTGTIDGSSLLSPRQGSTQAYLQTTGSVDNFLADPFNATVVPDSALEVFLGLPINSIDAFVGVTDLDGASEGATEGSGFRQTFEVTAPSTLTFDYAFASDELDQPSNFSDTAFFALDGDIFLLGNVENDDDFTTLSGSQYDGVIPYQTYTVGLDTGIHTVGFGVVDVSDAIVNSALLIDDLEITPGLPLVSSASSTSSLSASTEDAPVTEEPTLEDASALLSAVAAEETLLTADEAVITDVGTPTTSLVSPFDTPGSGESTETLLETALAPVDTANMSALTSDATIVNPEPSTGVLAVLAGVGLIWRRRRAAP